MREATIRPDIQKILKEKSSIKLDIGCGEHPTRGFVGMDILDLPGVDIVWDIEHTPWPLPDECASSVVASHVLEHLTPGYGDKRLQGLTDLLLHKKVFTEEEAKEWMGNPGSGFINVMNEIWRVLKPGAQFAFVCPNAESPGYQQDPTHQNMINNATMYYFDPLHPSGLYQFYRPRPWEIEFLEYQINGNIECILRKRQWDKSYEDPTVPKDQIQAEARTFVRELRKGVL